uniref:Uncharacterized protein n=1 Tax=Globisporangium ultimum (strain ATCC 200006 / CBS 805.95 / DAOM BR144) TaxID=431595 RepID=K3X7L0_GLOUD
MSLKYMLTAVPQLGAALLLLYYACTFHKPSSAVQQQLVIESCVHQSIAMLLQASILHATFHASSSLCCAFPVLCPIHTEKCDLASILPCPTRLRDFPHYDFVPRVAQCVATYALAFALASVRAAHRMKAMDARVRHAQFVTFERRPSAKPAPASVYI